MFRSKTNNKKKAEVRRIFQDIKGIDAQSEVMEFFIDKLALCGWPENSSLTEFKPTYNGSRVISFGLFDHKRKHHVGGVGKKTVNDSPGERRFINWEWGINVVNITNSYEKEWNRFSFESRCDLAGNPIGLFDV